MKQKKVKVLENKSFRLGYYMLTLQAPDIAKISKPGQFAEIKVNDEDYPLLRRPLSIHNASDKNIMFLYEVVGEATKILSARKKGEYLDIIAPLGNGFSLEPSSSNRQPILVAGGMGVAPLVFLAKAISKRKAQSAKRKTQNKNPKPIVIIGAKTKSQIVCEDEFKKLGCIVKVATDDGSKGFKGTATKLLENILAEGSRLLAQGKFPSASNLQPLTIFACGPRAMLKEVSCIAKEKNIKAQISLEEHMACGIGACLGCVVNTKKGYQRVCQEGPVFNSSQIIW